MNVSEIYVLRNAEERDIPFLVKVIIGAEKGNSDKLSFSTLFGLTEDDVEKYLQQMLEEEIDGCEFSVSSFMIVEQDENSVAGFGGWIEGVIDDMSSKMLKSNLILYCFPKESVEELRKNSSALEGFMIDRSKGFLQLEFLYILPEHRGQGLGGLLTAELIKRAQEQSPSIQGVQVQLFAENEGALRVYQKEGFEVKEMVTANAPDILNFLPFNKKVMMEKTLKK